MNVRMGRAGYTLLWPGILAMWVGGLGNPDRRWFRWTVTYTEMFYTGGTLGEPEHGYVRRRVVGRYWTRAGALVAILERLRSHHYVLW